MSTESSVQVDRHARAAEIISSAAAWSAAAGAVPLPLLDLVAVGTVQGKMVMDLAKLYGEPASSELARGVVSVLLGTLFPAGLTSALVGSSAKLVPVGALFGMASMAALSAAATYAIGKVFVRHFEKGGNLATFSPAAVKEELQREFSDAKSKQVSGAPA
jgi:uncharacterized protein (DUF697 family)